MQKWHFAPRESETFPSILDIPGTYKTDLRLRIRGPRLLVFTLRSAKTSVLVVETCDLLLWGGMMVYSYSKVGKLSTTCLRSNCIELEHQFVVLHEVHHIKVCVHYFT